MSRNIIASYGDYKVRREGYVRMLGAPPTMHWTIPQYGLCSKLARSFRGNPNIYSFPELLMAAKVHPKYSSTEYTPYWFSEYDQASRIEVLEMAIRDCDRQARHEDYKRMKELLHSGEYSGFCSLVRFFGKGLYESNYYELLSHEPQSHGWWWFNPVYNGILGPFLQSGFWKRYSILRKCIKQTSKMVYKWDSLKPTPWL